MDKLAVIAIGGNSLIEDSRHVTVASQFQAAVHTVTNIVDMMEEGWNVVIAHGNGPQVGYILFRSEYSSRLVHTVPLDSCVADTQGSIGYQLQKAFYNEFVKRGIKKNVATIVTQVRVDDSDPSFKDPAKPIGSFMTKEDAQRHARENGWDVKEDPGRGWRRVVASPAPKEIIELETIKQLISLGTVVIAAGGGGIPVARMPQGNLWGREAVVDKDLAAAILAKQLKADAFIISTAVEKVCLDYAKPTERKLDKMTVAEARAYASQGQFPKGSMLPKVQALCDYVETVGGLGIITDPFHLKEAIRGEGGTRIVR